MYLQSPTCLNVFLMNAFMSFLICVPAIFPPPSRCVTVPQILRTGFLGDGSVEHCFEKGRDAVWQRSEAVVLGCGDGTCDSSEAPEGESCVGVTHWLACSRVPEPGCSGRWRPNTLPGKPSAGQGREIREKHASRVLLLFAQDT